MGDNAIGTSALSQMSHFYWRVQGRLSSLLSPPSPLSPPQKKKSKGSFIGTLLSEGEWEKRGLFHFIWRNISFDHRRSRTILQCHKAAGSIAPLPLPQKSPFLSLSLSFSFSLPCSSFPRKERKIFCCNCHPTDRLLGHRPRNSKKVLRLPPSPPLADISSERC